MEPPARRDGRDPARETVSGGGVPRPDRGTVFVAVAVASRGANLAVARRRHLVGQTGLTVGQASFVRSSIGPSSSSSSTAAGSIGDQCRLDHRAGRTARVVVDLRAHHPSQNVRGVGCASIVMVNPLRLGSVGPSSPCQRLPGELAIGTDRRDGCLDPFVSPSTS